MTSGQITRRQALCAGAVTAVGAMTLRPAPAFASASASAEGDGLQLLVQVEGAAEPNRNVYEVTLGAFEERAGGSPGARGTSQRVSEWGDTTLAFRRPVVGANQEIHDWVANVRRGRRDERVVLVTAVLPHGQALRRRLEGCRPVAIAHHGFENGIGFIEVLTLAVRHVTSKG